MQMINPWSPSGSFMVQKMAITSPSPAFKGLMIIVIVIIMMMMMLMFMIIIYNYNNNNV